MSASFPRIRILKGNSLGKATFPIDTGELICIGRSTDNGVVLNDSLVSRHHAEVDFDGKDATIRDVGGKNPIRVNGEEIKANRKLAQGDRIAIGHTELVFEKDSAHETSVRVVPGREGVFEPGIGSISLDAATLRVGKPDLQNIDAAEKVYDRLSRLYLLSEELLSIGDEEELFDLALSTATKETQAERGFFALLSEGEKFDPRGLHVVRFWNPESGKEARTLEMSESIVQHISRERRAVLVRDVAESGDFGMSVIDLEIHSFICVPIMDRDWLRGLLYVDTRGRGQQLDRSDLEFVSAIGRMAGISLENIRIRRQLEHENEQLRSLFGGGTQELIGSSEAMQSIMELIEKVAPRDASVLITGENGTGKELIARAIHRRSARREKPFVAVNCAAIPPHLVESELFGHEKGAFTGAYRATEGKFDLANGGTLFLDEIGEMPLDMQVKILRALQERRFYPVGGQKETSVDIRVISATNRDLKSAIETDSFREDLFFRLAVITVDAPPLRERGDDVIEIAEYVLDQGGATITMTKAAKECLMSYQWPGNVRELRNVLEHAVILGDGRKITPADFPPHIRKKGRGKMMFRLKPLSEVEKRYIVRVLEECDGNKAKAASILGISRETLYQKLRQYDKDAAQ